MIRVRCRTNLDDYRGKSWPTIFTCRPILGDLVRAECGAVLKIRGITHAKCKEDLLDPHITGQNYLIIELNN